MASAFERPSANRPLDRDQYIALLKSALLLHEYRFASHAAANWLASFPGDLEFSLLHAQALVKENRLQTALPILHSLTIADPENYDAIQARYKVEQALSAQIESKSNASPPDHQLADRKQSDLLQWLVALRGAVPSKLATPSQEQITPWGEKLFDIRKILERITGGQSHAKFMLDEVEHQLVALLTSCPHSPIVAVTHLKLLRTRSFIEPIPGQTIQQLSTHYQAQYPQNILCALIRAETLMTSGQTDKAVALLHQCASRDVTGQVATRLWGISHAYKNLWPQDLTKSLDQSIPASLSAFLGWNQLPPGFDPPSAADQQNDPDRAQTSQIDTPGLGQVSGSTVPGNLPGDILGVDPNPTSEPVSYSDQILSQDTVPITLKLDHRQGDHCQSPASEPPKSELGTTDQTSEALQEVRAAFQRIAKQIHANELASMDGRYPVYVVMTTRSGLNDQYGVQTIPIIQDEILNFLKAVKNNTGWDTCLFYADEGLIEPGSKLVTQPATASDPWSLKLALVDLDQYLAKHGQMVAAVLILGGPQVVPFHLLPNPVDDSDDSVPSDNPYSTSDENYFIPEWLVGRIPTPTDDQGSFLINTLRNLSQAHQDTDRVSNALRASIRWWEILKWIRLFLPGLSGNGDQKSSFGYTAAAWRFASFEVFRKIGEPKKMVISPFVLTKSRLKTTRTYRRYWPRTFKPVSKQAHLPAQDQPRTTPGVVIPFASLGYFNLHGTLESAAWFGQSDPTEAGFQDQNSYPVALQPQDIGHEGQRAPEIVFTEACFGANVTHKQASDALVFRFFEKGTYAFVGSTCVSYGAIKPPLTAADLLGLAFWKGIRQGLPAGESLRKAKISLAKEMDAKQGFLDGEDQKTLISFTLYGDPLAQSLGISKSLAKSVQRPHQPYQVTHTLSDHSLEPVDFNTITPEYINQVKNIVERYLPGMSDAHMTLRDENLFDPDGCQVCGAKGNWHASWYTRQFIPPSGMGKGLFSNPHRIVILSQDSRQKDQDHQNFARITLDNAGKIVKLVVSR
ncbi:MAG: hypothetical protein JW862_13070 [Anaerolineales bacterium]|nr:hypothetical protein [Anaerolineales bacterium]